MSTLDVMIPSSEEGTNMEEEEEHHYAVHAILGNGRTKDADTSWKTISSG